MVWCVPVWTGGFLIEGHVFLKEQRPGDAEPVLHLEGLCLEVCLDAAHSPFPPGAHMWQKPSCLLQSVGSVLGFLHGCSKEQDQKNLRHHQWSCPLTRGWASLPFRDSKGGKSMYFRQHSCGSSATAGKGG